ncbi:tRNA (cytidine(32)/guanosine(34)-2'-O)-methyltransferase [Purpureocillium takamizusanense]|uniref:tRNA (Cytidine(32)/guanosine(34)-2'-O)-methyltransferase n=1 Tax=Purpureocillium takamizusanense TaxID=2060973 RepID=A0A9Q8QNL8_9HYPO|nr:tRNA (cytidine(32)/guanosine(34)-2'-O)-methyltransferase [Purpureocillium takamizusanense]UNI22527.1 tRNA (cytidine(32)/guanosine(34)-2'-O)-methyltransferase [Purpureocillium takamizusanense]
MNSPPQPRMTTTLSSDKPTHARSNALQDAISAVAHDASASPAQSAVLFRANTIAPSPPPSQIEQQHPRLLPTTAQSATDKSSNGPATPLRISTDLQPRTPNASTALPPPDSLSSNRNLSPSRFTARKASAGSLHSVSRTPSLKAALTNSIGSAGTSSVIPSPVIAAMGDMTPLPSPLLSGDSPGPWKKLGPAEPSSPPRRARLRSLGEASVLVTSGGEPIEVAAAHASKRKMYASLDGAHAVPPPPISHDMQQSQQSHHSRARSISDYVPEPMTSPKRPVVVSGSHARRAPSDSMEAHIRREPNYAESRGLTAVAPPPTPPPSESSRDSSDATKPKESRYEYFHARTRGDNKLRRWRAISFLGQGTFSRVMLATSQTDPGGGTTTQPGSGSMSPAADGSLDRKKLVAIKVCEHGPRGGASEERVEMSLKRELEIMQSIHHPSLVNLKAWSIEPTRAILVLSYCPGGDLFDIATAHRSILKPALMRRMFAEIVGAVGYLHERRIVHRDIKLENVLVNLTPEELGDPAIDWQTFPHSIVTVADLGLSRRIADDEKLETRCGSDDYAAPEVIMGQPYDGRATDAWSLGVLLYALLEARLPFDPHPGMSDAHRMRSRTSHRIARVEWRWAEYAGEDGDHEANEAKFAENNLLGAMEITEGLLKRARSRWSVAKVAAQEWVRDALKIPGGLQFREEDDGQEV